MCGVCVCVGVVWCVGVGVVCGCGCGVGVVCGCVSVSLCVRVSRPSVLKSLQAVLPRVSVWGRVMGRLQAPP